MDISFQYHGDVPSMQPLVGCIFHDFMMLCGKIALLANATPWSILKSYTLRAEMQNRENSTLRQNAAYPEMFLCKPCSQGLC
jgi:hypothetical protein